MKEKRKYTQEFRQEAVRRAFNSGSVTKTARDLGIPKPTLKTWYRKFQDEMGPKKPENERLLQLENARLKQENSFLKKAAAYFAKEPK